MSVPVTGKYTCKTYRCTGCGTEKQIGTNHWGQCYPYCGKCNTITVWECLEPVPDGYGVPEPWKLVSLGDVCEITPYGRS